MKTGQDNLSRDIIISEVAQKLERMDASGRENSLPMHNTLMVQTLSLHSIGVETLCKPC